MDYTGFESVKPLDEKASEYRCKAAELDKACVTIQRIKIINKNILRLYNASRNRKKYKDRISVLIQKRVNKRNDLNIECSHVREKIAILLNKSRILQQRADIEFNRIARSNWCKSAKDLERLKKMLEA